ncbi:unnamed protein product [Trichobilharzia regenti]|nr:unnamed protein product [Trichobilharzia regenti]
MVEINLQVKDTVNIKRFLLQVRVLFHRMQHFYLKLLEELTLS